MLKKILISTFVIMTLLAIGIVLYIVYLYNSFDIGFSESYVELDREQSELRPEDADESVESFTVLILGIDELATDDDTEDNTKVEKERLEREVDEDALENLHPEEKFNRTDTMILATFKKDTDEVKMVGIPRDTLTYIESVDYFDKINHGHMYDGPKGAVTAVENLLNVPVDYYITVNMSAVVDIVDALNGIEYDVPFDMDEPNSMNRGRIILEEGPQVLDGEGALAVVRSRRMDSDLARNQRQIDMVYRILDKAKSNESILMLDSLISVVSENIEHNIPQDVLRSLAAYYAFNDIEFNTVQLRGDDFWTENMAAYFFKANEEHLYLISNHLREDLGLEPSDVNDIMNIRLRDHMNPYTYLEDEILYDYKPDIEPYFMSYYYVSKLGDGINIPEVDEDDERYMPVEQDKLERFQQLD